MSAIDIVLSQTDKRKDEIGLDVIASGYKELKILRATIEELAQTITKLLDFMPVCPSCERSTVHAGDCKIIHLLNKAHLVRLK